MTAGSDAHGEFGAGDYWRVWNLGSSFSQALAGSHESAHRALAATTSWGVATSVYSLLADAAKGSQFSEVQRGMIAASRNCHEAYATYLTLTFVDESSVLLAYPQYRRHLTQAERIVRHVPPAAARVWVLEAALTACMNVRIIERILIEGFEEFSLADVRSAEYPDQRMRILAGVERAEWDEVWRNLRDKLEGQDGWEALSQPSGNIDPAVMDVIPESFLQAFHECTYHEIVARLKERGVQSLGWQEYTEFMPALLTAFGEFSSSPREVTRLINILRPINHSASFVGQSRLILRDEPRRAHLVAAEDLDADAWQGLLQGTRPRAYLYLLARRTWNLKESYKFSEEDQQLLPSDPNTSVTLLRAEQLAEEATVRLVLLSSPAQLAEAVEALRPDYLLSNPSVMMLHDSHWLQEWFEALADYGPFAVRIDLDPIVLLDAWCKPDNRIRYSYLDMRDETGQLARVFVFQWSSLPGDHVFVAVSSPDVATSLGIYLADRYSDCSDRDDDLVGEVVGWLRVILTAMLDDQHEFKFHGLIERWVVEGSNGDA